MASTNLLDLPKLLTPEDVAAQLRVTVGTLAVWRCTQRYPLRYLKLGRAIRYRPEDVQEFLQRGASR